MKKIFENNVNVKPNSKSCIDVPINGSSISNVMYSDSIDDMKVVYYSAETEDEEIINEPIRSLIFKENVKKLRIVIDNPNPFHINGMITVRFDQEEIFIDRPAKMNGIDYSYDEIMGLGNTAYLEEVENNHYLNNISPVKVDYYKTEPDMKSADYMLNEYGIRELVGKQCISVISKNNSLPQEESAMYTEWGYNYSRFNIALSKKYFEEKFGKGKFPRVGDFLIFMAGGMMMNVSSIQSVFGANRCLVGWNLSLSHYAVNGSVKGVDDIEQFANTSEKWFNQKNANDTEDTMNSTYNVADYLHNDYNRSLLLSDVLIQETKDFNYYIIRNKHREGLSAITYRGLIDITKNFAISFSIKSSEDDDIFMIGNNISIGVTGGSIYVKEGNDIVTLETEMSNEEWKTILISFNRNNNKNSITVYDDNKAIRQCESDVRLPDNCIISENEAIMNVISSNSEIRKIRVWKNIIPIEYEARVILNEIVEKPSSAYVIDNCEQVIQTRKHARPSNVDLWRDFLKNKTNID